MCVSWKFTLLTGMNGFTLTCWPRSFSESSPHPTTASALLIWLRCGDSFISMVGAVTLIMSVGRLPLLYVSKTSHFASFTVRYDHCGNTVGQKQEIQTIDAVIWHIQYNYVLFVWGIFLDQRNKYYMWLNDIQEQRIEVSLYSDNKLVVMISVFHTDETRWDTPEQCSQIWKAILCYRLQHACSIRKANCYKCIL